VTRRVNVFCQGKSYRLTGNEPVPFNPPTPFPRLPSPNRRQRPTHELQLRQGIIGRRFVESRRIGQRFEQHGKRDLPFRGAFASNTSIRAPGFGASNSSGGCSTEIELNFASTDEIMLTRSRLPFSARIASESNFEPFGNSLTAISARVSMAHRTVLPPGTPSSSSRTSTSAENLRPVPA